MTERSGPRPLAEILSDLGGDDGAFKKQWAERRFVVLARKGSPTDPIEEIPSSAASAAIINSDRMQIIFRTGAGQGVGALGPGRRHGLTLEEDMFGTSERWHDVQVSESAANLGADRHVACPDLALLSDDTLKELAKRFRFSPEEVVAFYKRPHPWYTNEARDRADVFASEQKPKFTESMRAIHQAVTWAWSGAIPALSRPQRVGWITIAIKALGLKDCGGSTIKKYMAYMAAIKDAKTKGSRSRPKKTNAD